MKPQSYLSCTVLCTSIYRFYLFPSLRSAFNLYTYINFATKIKSEIFPLILDFVLSRFNTKIRNTNENSSIKSQLVASHSDGLLICKYWHIGRRLLRWFRLNDCRPPREASVSPLWKEFAAY